MFTLFPFTRFPTRWLRVVALLGVGLVGVLSWLAANPMAHAAWHAASGETGGCAQHGQAHDESGASQGDNDAGCVITAFLAGATDLLALLFLVLLFALRVLVRVRPVDFFPVESSGRAHAPSCGPPVWA
ncbi:hypothetical protein [Oleiharenicola lentus]|uniref:hypothetical protein n=1 Tax=Oleiharenicola lentus TaxID=2508720 RepID=UPI003F66F6A0